MTLDLLSSLYDSLIGFDFTSSKCQCKLYCLHCLYIDRRIRPKQVEPSNIYLMSAYCSCAMTI